VANRIFPQLTEEQISLIAGEGIITLGATGDPVIVALDGAANVAREVSIAKNPQGEPAVTPSGSGQYFDGDADYIVLDIRGGNNTIYAAWKDVPEFIEVGVSDEKKIPFNLRKGDLIRLKAKRQCSEMTDGNAGLFWIDSIVMYYSGVKIVSGLSQDYLQFFLIGQKAKD
jgi:hypothetical protein